MEAFVFDNTGDFFFFFAVVNIAILIAVDWDGNFVFTSMIKNKDNS